MSTYTLQDLGPGVALDVSDAGEVCGRNDSGERDGGGWVWRNGTRTIIMGTNADGLSFRAHTATEMREDGSVLGDLLFISMDPSSVKRFIWANGKFALVGDGPAPLSTRTTNAGLTVGSRHMEGGAMQHAIATETAPGNLVHDLNFSVQAPGWILVAANAINKRGQICGGGVFNGQAHAFLLTPVANRVSAVESYAGIKIDGLKGKTVRISASDTEWNGEWKELQRVIVLADNYLWIDDSGPRRRNRDYKVEVV